MKKLQQNLRLFVALMVAMVLSSPAFAAFTPPAGAADAFTQMGEAYEWIESQIWVIIPAIAIGWFLIRMFKKGANKVG